MRWIYTALGETDSPALPGWPTEEKRCGLRTPTPAWPHSQPGQEGVKGGSAGCAQSPTAADGDTEVSEQAAAAPETADLSQLLTTSL